MTIARSAVGFVAVLGMLAEGCALTDDAQVLVNSCSANSDCATGVCDNDICVTPSTEPIEIGIEVIPATGPSGGAPVSWTFPPQTVTGPAQRDLALPSPLTVIGSVRWKGNRIPAELTFERQSPFAGGPVTRVKTSTVAEASVAADGTDSDYSARLVAGQSYAVTVVPTGELAPEELGFGSQVPWLRVLPERRFVVEGPSNQEASSGLVARVDVEWPDSIESPCAAGEDRGCALRGEIVSVGEVDVAEPDLQVSAIEIESGNVVSSIAVTQDDGSFDMRISETAENYVIRVTGGTERPLFPALTVDPQRLIPGEQSLRIRVPRVEPISYVGLVSTADEMRTPVDGAIVTFESDNVFDDEQQIVGRYRATATADEQGRFEAQLLPGMYDVVVTPSGSRDSMTSGDAMVGSRDLAVVAESVRIMAPAQGTTVQGLAFVLPERATFGGTVASQDGRPMNGVPIQAVALGAAESTSDDVASHNRSSDSVTGDGGSFDLRLDLGRYDLFVQPPGESRFPWFAMPEVTVNQIGEDAEPMRRNVNVRAPVPVRGMVLASDGSALAGAELRAYAIVEVEGEARSIQIGETVTGDEGSYELLLPPDP